MEEIYKYMFEIKAEICKIIGIDQSDLILGETKSKIHVVYGRIIFAHYFNMKCARRDILRKELNASESTIRYYLNKYNDEIEFGNKVFISLDNQLKSKINAN